MQQILKEQKNIMKIFQMLFFYIPPIA